MVRSPQSAVHGPQSTVRSPWSAVHSPQSTVHSPPFILTDIISDTPEKILSQIGMVH